MYKPEGCARGRIFAFHDFGGSWRTSWTWSPTSDAAISPSSGVVPSPRSVFWLRDLLPQEFPHCAIYSVGYGPQDAKFTRYGNFAQHFDQHLKSTPLDERAPTVFIAHGMGGNVLKRVLEELEAECYTRTPQLDDLKRFIFLGVSTDV
ncbi:hypothetical protein K402DRAFT_19116 [Aulographum hederae CBS 113979]|uniref:DUF676 domain-containing protein n=1 Tax=Aulographum hederae CBS 113979 TaxID=1176131 RepID=A0A6G1H694_9PEZI|nr:hypothetical protein K402DRAFT_19116 [Aulographum hederae CBS 113979]